MQKNILFFEPGTNSKTLENTLELESLIAHTQKGFVWIDCVTPERIELEDIAVLFGIHRVSIGDCFDNEQIPKMDIFNEYTALVFNDFSVHEGGFIISEMNIFIGEQFILSVRRENSPISEHIRIAADKSMKNGQGALQCPSLILHLILDAMIDRTFAVVDETTDRIVNLEESVITDGKPLDPEGLRAIRRDLLVLRKSLSHEREILSRIRRKDSVFIPESDMVFYGDIFDHLAKFSDMTETGREMLANLVQMNLALSNNAMAEAANRTNQSVSRLTFITTIFMPLTLIAGIGGMSEWTFITGPENWKLSYGLLIAGMCAIALISYGILRWMGKKK